MLPILWLTCLILSTAVVGDPAAVPETAVQVESTEETQHEVVAVDTAQVADVQPADTQEEPDVPLSQAEVAVPKKATEKVDPPDTVRKPESGKDWSSPRELSSRSGNTLTRTQPAKSAADAPPKQTPPEKVKELTVKLDPKPAPTRAAEAPAKAPAPKVHQPEEEPGMVTRLYSAAKSMVNRAWSWLGTSYVWGGSSRNGVDCSGLTQILYKAEGVLLPHNAKAQFKRGTPVAKKDLRPGDLVFFNTRGPLTHVGVYIGESKFIHAANRKRGVRVDNLNSSYYKNRYAGARRYKNLEDIG